MPLRYIPDFYMIFQEGTEPGEYTIFLESWVRGRPPKFKLGELEAMIVRIRQFPWVKEVEHIGRQEIKILLHPSAGGWWEIKNKFKTLSSNLGSWRGKNYLTVTLEEYLENIYPDGSLPAFLVPTNQLKMFNER